MKNTKPLKTQLYILGMLARFGPQHGYSLKQRLEEQVADFARIELGNIYYHLKRMNRSGWVSETRSQEGRRPQRSVFTITNEGEAALDGMLRQALHSDFWAEFSIDAALFFADRLSSPGEILSNALKTREETMNAVLSALRTHRDEILERLPPQAALMASALFRHHELHYDAELRWTREVLKSLESTYAVPNAERRNP
jgi:DNA-binding PadR family transcriptional regulator